MTKVPKIYTLTITKTIVIGTEATSLKDAHNKTETDLMQGLYQEQWEKARSRIELIGVEASST